MVLNSVKNSDMSTKHDNIDLVSYCDIRNNCGNSTSSLDTNPLAVFVNNACKYYNKGSPVLDNFNMQVSRGTIYGLLGASGCGKTTILSCIIGLRRLDSGEIKVFGNKPGTPCIGYMPQDVALFTAFTIKEILAYFGRIYGMTQTEIQARTEFLVSFLDLPDSSNLIKNLSGGQQRRTSLAVALVNQPELLILDEPTVGVDPLIRESIWEHLRELMEKRQTTIIITTHYIEEARQSNSVGIMRKGRLLRENNPNELLTEYNESSLERVFLKLCQEDLLRSKQAQESKVSSSPNTNKIKIYNSIKVKEDQKGSSKIKAIKSLSLKSVKSSIKSHMNKVFSVVSKNYVTLIRTPWFPFALVLIPTIHMILFSLVVGKEPKYNQLGVVNNEFNRKDINLLEFCRNKNSGCLSNWTSCKYLNLFKEDEIKWVSYESETEALKSVEKGTTWGFISIPENYTYHLRDRALANNFALEETINGTIIISRLDMSFSLKTNYIVNQLLNNLQDYAIQLARECEKDPRSVELPLKFNAIYGSYESGYMEFLQPTQLSMVIFMIPMACCLTYISDRKSGTLDRSWVAGVKHIHFLMAYIITEGSLIILQLALSCGISITVFNFSVKGSFFLYYFIGFLEGLTGLTLGFLIATFCDQEIEALLYIMGMYLPVMVSSGGIFPLEGIMPWAKVLCYSLPISWPMDALRSIVTRGWGLTHPKVWPAIAIMLSWIFAVCTLSGLIVKFKRR